MEIESRAPAKPSMAPTDALTIPSAIFRRFSCPAVTSASDIGANQIRMPSPNPISMNRMSRIGNVLDFDFFI